MTDQREPGLRQRKQAATALTIERSAVALVQEHGFQAVTVDMICAASGVSQRTFFNYFKTKDQAILGAGPGRLDERRVREFLASDSPDLLAGILDLLATVANPRVPFGTVAEIVFDRLGLPAGHDEHVVNAGGNDPFENVLQDWFTLNFEHRLGNLLGEFPHARAFAGG